MLGSGPHSTSPGGGKSTKPVRQNNKVLVAEGDAAKRTLIEQSLQAAGYTTVQAGDGAAALRAFYQERPDLMVVATDLVVHDGWQVLSRIREVSEMPVILLGQPDGVNQSVRGLQAGADDYVMHHCPLPELTARVEALVRRAASARPAAVTVVLGTAQLEIDLDARTVHSDGAELAVTPLEFRLLTTFLRHPNQTLSAEQLLQQAWEDGSCVGTERVKFAVARLRTKLTADGSPDPISALRGFGYRFHPLSA